MLSSLLVNILTIVSILLVIRHERKKEMRHNQERYQALVKAISEQKDKEYQKEQRFLERIHKIEHMYDNELEAVRMSIQQNEGKKTIEIEKLNASIEKLMLLIEGLNTKIAEMMRRVSELENLTKVLYEFIGYTKGEKNATQRGRQKQNP